MTADEPQWLTEDERAAWLAASAVLIRLPAALDAQLQADHGLTFFEYMVLAVLSEREDRTLQMSDIAAATSSSLSRLSHVVKRLEAQGLVRRERVPGAGRRTNAVLTDAGFAKVVAAAPGHVARVRDLLVDAVPAEDLAALRRIGETVLGRIDPEDRCP
ncbi:MarR family winged helix-turn-helix transcriptional regulator [Nocardioides KLBMP 9356]|uniref:MarR family winged helix-turn-helix transcriptional regulator n=1 Tax=Nocardioides potassii TaxID=2911371 RepID=A0ABS9HHK9_9ACTN|nr:MarR family winged helix-turn-helix transcriptional regulator [Nocardioides potassii]MCF6379872.1 MarR family winged helix-turn-helix transcriptional regulator [Nocardioides potassii]